MKHNATIYLAVCTLIYAGTMQGMLCRFVPKTQRIFIATQHTYCHTKTDDTSHHSIKISKNCLDRLKNVDETVPSFFRYLEIKLQNTIEQEASAGRPSLIIEKHKRNAPKICPDLHDCYLDRHLPLVYRQLNNEFETYYQDICYGTTRTRLLAAFVYFNDKPLQKKSKKTINALKKQLIGIDSQWLQKPITIFITKDGDIIMPNSAGNSAEE